jgi:hypothetical protein
MLIGSEMDPFFFICNPIYSKCRRTLKANKSKKKSVTRTYGLDPDIFKTSNGISSLDLLRCADGQHREKEECGSRKK